MLSGLAAASLAKHPRIAPTTTTLKSLVSPATVGQPVTFEADVAYSVSASAASGRARATRASGLSGKVNFFEGTRRLNRRTLRTNAAGVATFTISTLAKGTHQITAVFAGTRTASRSTSAPVSESIVAKQAKSWTTLTSSVNPVVVGHQVTYTATVYEVDAIDANGHRGPSGGTDSPTGTVDFYDNGTEIASGPVTVDPATGTAQCTVAYSSSDSSSVGEHSIYAVYSGDSTYGGSTSDTLTEIVAATPTATQVWLWPSDNPAQVGEPVTFTAFVTTGDVQGNGGPRPMVVPGGPIQGVGDELGATGITGNVDFYVDGATTPTYTAAVGADGQATFTTSTLAMGSHTITAVYSGDDNFAGSTSALTEYVGRAETWTTLASSVNPVMVDNQVTYTATVSDDAADVPGGSVTFYDNGTAIGQSQVQENGDQWSFSTTYSGVGSHSVQAVYSGDSTHAGSTSDTLTETVTDTKTATQVWLWGSPNPAVVGAPITFTAYVSAADPSSNGGATPMIYPPIGEGGATGTVDFVLDGVTDLGTASLDANGTATLTTSTPLGLGPHKVVATYSGDSNFASSTSATLGENVVAPTPGTVVGKGTLLNGQDKYDIDVKAAAPNPSATPVANYYSGTFSYQDTDTANGINFTASAITSISFGWGWPMPLEASGGVGGASPNTGPMPPIWLGSRATITGTATAALSDGSGSSVKVSGNFVAYVNNWGGPVMNARPAIYGSGSIWIEFTDASGKQVYSGGGPLDPGSTLTITVATPSATSNPKPIPPLVSPGPLAHARRAVFAAWGQQDSSHSKHHRPFHRAYRP